MKITCSRTRWLEIAVFVYSPARGLRPDHCTEKDSRSRVRGLRSSHPVFGKVPSHHCGLTRFGNSEVSFVLLSLLSLCFVIIIKYFRAQGGTQAIISPLSFLSVALELNGYFEWLSFLFSKGSTLLSKQPTKSLSQWEFEPQWTWVLAYTRS